jgi:hypothetical protein
VPIDFDENSGTRSMPKRGDTEAFRREKIEKNKKPPSKI